MKFLLGLLIFLSLNIKAEDLIRLDKAPYPGAHMKIQSQEDSNLCYAYTAVYLIDYERNDEATPSSPLLFGIDYKNNVFQVDKIRSNTPDFGHVCDSISKVKRVFLKQDDKNIVEDKNYKLFIHQLQLAYAHFDSRKDPSKQADKINCEALGTLNNMLGLNKGLTDILDTLTAPDFMNFLALTILEDQKATKTNYQCKEAMLMSEDPKALVDLINEGLSLKKPIGISYCSLLWTKGEDYKGMRKGFFESKKTPTDLANKCGLHASVVVGKRVVNGRIQYLIQDTAGKDFKYNNDFEKENGRIWVDEKTLANNLYKTTFIMNPEVGETHLQD